MFSVVFYLLLVVWAVMVFAAKSVAPHLGMPSQQLMVVASVVFAPIALFYVLSFRFMIIAPALARWAKRQGVTLGHIRRCNARSVPIAVSVPVLRTTQYQGWYCAEIISEGRVTGMAYFRLLIIAPIGYAAVRAASIEPA